MNGVTDDELVRRAAAGDRAAWSGLVSRHLAALVAFAWYRLDDHAEAEDVAQETMLRLSRKVHDWEPGEAGLRTWLFRVAHNLCIDRLRVRRPTRTIESVHETELPHTDTQIERNLGIEQTIRRALSLLPQRQQTVLTLVYCQGYKVKEVSAILQISEHAAESLLARARQSMRATLQPDLRELLGVER